MDPDVFRLFTSVSSLEERKKGNKLQVKRTSEQMVKHFTALVRTQALTLALSLTLGLALEY